METDIEPYEETINYYNCRTPVNSWTSSPATVAETPTFQSTTYGPIFSEGIVLPAPAPQPDPAKTKLTGKSAAVGAECVRAGGRKCATILAP